MNLSKRGQVQPSLIKRKTARTIWKTLPESQKIVAAFAQPAINVLGEKKNTQFSNLFLLNTAAIQFI